jgi:exodeoxyribonuclease V alpha subunit
MPVAPEAGDTDFYVITADTPEDIQAKLLRVVTERIPQRFGLHPIRDVQVLLDEVALAYATTVHKSQGSEYPAVVIPLATQHYPMLARNLLYTGVTRGKQLVVLIGQPKACALAVRNVRAMRRLTSLVARLRQ